MVRTEFSIQIDRPVEEVYKYVTDGAKLKLWIEGFIEERITHDANGGVGTKLHRVYRRNGGRRYELDGEVVGADPNRRRAVELRGKNFRILATYIFEDLGDGRTRLTQISDVWLHGFLGKVVELFRKPAAGRRMKKGFGRLKKLLESEPR